MKKILDVIPCISLVGLFVYLIQDYRQQYSNVEAYGKNI